MLAEIKVPKEYVTGGEVRKIVAVKIDEVQCLNIDPTTTIKIHSHDDGQWEVWINIQTKSAYICPRGEKHELVNKSDEKVTIMAIKGHENYSFDDLAQFFAKLGFYTYKGSLIVEKKDYDSPGIA